MSTALPRRLLPLLFLSLATHTILAAPTPTPSPTPATRTVRFTWSASVDPVKGYKIFWGGGSGNYQNVRDVGAVVSASLTLPSSTSTYVAVSAYDLTHTSSFSNEVVVPPATGPW